MDVSRITHGGIELRKSRISLADVLRDATESVGSSVQERNHRLTIEMPDEAVFIDADESRLVQVFSNLLNNAVRYTPSGGTITLRTETADHEVQVIISDTGQGIAEEMLDRIFKKFVRSPEDQSSPNGGLGIGLTLAQSLVERHGGTIAATSDGPGRGSEFRVRLPRVQQLEGPDGRTATPAAAAHSGARRVLVVDDNADAVEALAMLLRMQGQRVAVARDGRSAIEIASAFEPEIAIVDIGLPDISGHEVARHLRKTLGKRVYLVALTGWGQQADRDQTRDAGFDVHLVKPARSEDLRALLTRQKMAPSSTGRAADNLAAAVHAPTPPRSRPGVQE